MLQKSLVYTPAHAIDLINKCRENNYAIEISHKDIFEFTDKDLNKKKFFIKNVKQFKVVKGSDFCFVKFDHKENFNQFKILNSPCSPNFLISIPKQLNPKGISKTKFDNLCKLIPAMPPEFADFYLNLEKFIVGGVTDW